MSLSLGWFHPSSVFGPRVEELCGAIHSIVGISSDAFPVSLSPTVEQKSNALYYGVVRGHVPIHCDTHNPHQRYQAMWTFVLEAENRPALLAHPADELTARNILIPRSGSNTKQPYVGIELEPGTAFHMDPTKNFHGITQYPTGDPIPALPGLTIIQLPHVDGRDIAFALKEAKRLILLDERMAEFIQA